MTRGLWDTNVFIYFFEEGPSTSSSKIISSKSS
jgi:hypothetical protein